MYVSCVLRIISFLLFLSVINLAQGDDSSDIVRNYMNNEITGNMTKLYSASFLTYCNDPKLNENMKYVCYTKNETGAIIRQIIKFKSRPSLRKSSFNGTKDTKVIIPGYLNDEYTETVQAIIKSFLTKYDCNILVIDWSQVKCASLYHIAVDHASKIGKHAAEMIDFLVRRSPSKTKQFYVIGYSLGGHIAGFVGRKLRTGKLQRITGLDPAEPLIDSRMLYKLKKTDALFVDIIHTSSATFGHRAIMGHADFLPNNGRSPQPGCESNHFIRYIAEFQAAVCSHTRAIQFFNESIFAENGYFLSAQCDNWSTFKSGECNNNTGSLMGETATLGINGTYYLFTGIASPFALSNDSLPADITTTTENEDFPIITESGEMIK